MEQFVGRDVHIPADEFKPPWPHPCDGWISDVTQPSARYPQGRVEVSLPGTRLKYMWQVHLFKKEWILQTSTWQASYGQAASAKKRGRTPSRARSRARDAGGESENEAGPSSPPARSRRPSSGAAEITTPRARSKSPKRARSRSPGPKATRSLLRDSNRSATGNRVQFKDVPVMHPLTEVPRLSRGENLFNALLMLSVALPALYLGYLVCTASPTGTLARPVTYPVDPNDLLTLDWWVRLGLHEPLVFVNVVFFVNVNVLFWVISQLQGSTWLIDPYWTIIPLMLHFFYSLHPKAVSEPYRAIAISTLIRVWFGRLTHSYFRREEYQFGAREDWRYSDLSRHMGKYWPFISFFATYLVQQLMLVGVTLPVYAVYTSTAAWAPLDTVAAVLATAGLVTSWVADNQLREFMTLNEDRKALGCEPYLLLNTGLWKYSRHPNYFGEQLFWWGLSLFAYRLGQPWMVLGTLFNTLCMIPVTMLTEARMLRRPERAEVYRHYQETTSVWVPWFKFKTIKTD